MVNPPPRTAFRKREYILSFGPRGHPGVTPGSPRGGFKTSKKRTPGLRSALLHRTHGRVAETTGGRSGYEPSLDEHDGDADDAEDDDDFVRKPPREEDGEVCLPVGIC